MIQVPVKTLWQVDKVGINEERYVKPALDTGQGLYLLLATNGEVMEIPFLKVYSAQVARSEQRFRDKYSGPDYYLVYYKWEATAKQGALI